MNYGELIEKKDFNTLSNLSFINELIEKKYKDKYLIEYLLENNVHSDKMDDYLKYHEFFIPFYLKYNILEPLLKCSTKVLLKKMNNNLIFDLILDKLNDEDKIKLYYNLRITSYNDFHYLERDIIDIYLRHGIILPVIFVTTKLEVIEDFPFDDDIILEFKKTFHDVDIRLLDFITNELKRSLLYNHDRTLNDIKKLIKFKQENPRFKIIDIKEKLYGSYDNEKLILETNSRDTLTFNHELSHLLFQSTNENNENILEQYEDIRSKIDNQENLLKIKKYLKIIHDKYNNLREKIAKLYDEKIIEYYGSFAKYFEKIYLDMKEHTPDLLETIDKDNKKHIFPYITEINLVDVVNCFIENEKYQFINQQSRKNMAPYLMLENLLDALLNGKLFDDLEFGCLSGHSSLYYIKEITNSFDECLANFDAINKLDKKNEIILILKELVGNDLIELLNNYIVNNREGSYGSR